MSYDKSVSDHYLHGDLLNAIEATLPTLGKTTAHYDLKTNTNLITEGKA